MVGIVGQSGSGKSTIMKLLPRLYNLEDGVIRIDDYDIQKVDLDSLRQQPTGNSFILIMIGLLNSMKHCLDTKIH